MYFRLVAELSREFIMYPMGGGVISVSSFNLSGQGFNPQADAILSGTRLVTLNFIITSGDFTARGEYFVTQLASTHSCHMSGSAAPVVVSMQGKG